MKTLEFGIGSTLAKVITSLQNTSEEEVTLIIPKEAPLIQNSMNIRIIEEEAKRLGKKVQFAEGLVIPEETPEFIKSPEVGAEEFADRDWESSVEVNVPKIPGKKFFPPFKGLAGLNLNRKRVLWVGLGVGVLSILGAIAFLFSNTVSAKVTLYLDSQSVDKQLSISGSTQISEIDVDKKTIPLVSIDITKTASSSAKASGKKTVGNPAKGSVSVRNYNTVTDKTFAKGTVIKITAGDLEGAKYSLDSAVTVPRGSTSSRIDSSGKKINEIDPGRKEVAVTSSDIGEKYNVGAGTNFVVGGEGFENVNAVSEAAFSGGSSKEVTVVSSEDSTSLEEKITDNLKKAAKEEFASQIKVGQKLVEGVSIDRVNKKTLSKQVGEEADSFSLSIDAKLSSLAYNQKDVETLISKSIEQSITEGYQLGEGSEITAEVVKAVGKEVSLLARLKGVILTKVDKANLIENIMGKPLDTAENYLKGQSNIAGYEIVIKPSLPAPFNKLPTSSGKITVEMVKKN